MTQPTIQTLNAEALSGRLQQLAQGASIQHGISVLPAAPTPPCR